jgi:DNA (cytosine-5)-methyltransferase 1
MEKLTVVDIFCGAGGFSEGFRQEGFEIIYGIDFWEQAIKTFNHNFGLNCSTKNVLDFETSIKEIETIPDTDIILGSPPCVTFSSSNLSGKADKTTGIKLTETFLRIVALKKWKAGSRLKAWFMENVPSSQAHLKSEYTFENLGLKEWAEENQIGKSTIAIKLEGNHALINSSSYGTAQSRERLITGEIIKRNKLIVPAQTHSNSDKSLHKIVALKKVKNKLPKPNCKMSCRIIQDPLYRQIKIRLNQLTDHFYDTGLFECQWKQSKYLKTNHPYMGKMSFPEDENKPSRTITATKIGTSRESIIYKSEYKRSGNGEYRTYTIREASSLMGFPITFQFIGGENAKWRLVGNAVCPPVSRAIAKQVRIEYGLTELLHPHVIVIPILINVKNLNTFLKKRFSNRPIRNKGSRFRRHPFKDGNITVTLSNYDIKRNGKNTNYWLTPVQYGNGKGFPIFNFSDGYYKKIEPVIKKTKNGKKFLNNINNGFAKKIGKSITLQEMYEKQQSHHGLLEPTELIEKLARLIEGIGLEQEEFEQNGKVIFRDKKTIPIKQLFALYGINKISTIANK